MKLSEYVSYDAVGLAELIQASEVASSELIACANRAIDQTNDVLNAVVDRFDPTVAGNADGELAGVPFLVKDLVLHIEGKPTSMGSRALSNNAYISQSSSEMFRRFQEAGLETIGVTSTPEFGFNVSCEALAYGSPTRNPYDPTRSPGGSSGGAAAAVAAGIVPIAHANDGGGSIRIPAACCGLIGLKPTRGRTPIGPNANFPLLGMGIEFAVSRTVRDSALLLDLVEGPELGALFEIPRPEKSYRDQIKTPPKCLKIAFATTLPGSPSPNASIVDAILKTAHFFEQCGHDVVEAGPKYNAEEFNEACFIGWSTFLAGAVGAFSEQTGTKGKEQNFERGTLACAHAGASYSALDIERALGAMNRLSRTLARFMLEFDVFLLPTTSQPTWPIGRLNQNAEWSTGRDWFDEVFSVAPYTAPFNMTGQPAISIPTTSSGGLPGAVQLVGRTGEEHTLLKCAAQLESAQLDFIPRPVIYAGDSER